MEKNNQLNIKIIKRTTISNKGNEIDYSAQFIENGFTATIIFSIGAYTTDFNHLVERVHDYIERHKKDNKLENISYQLISSPEEKTIITNSSLNEEEAKRFSSSLDELIG